MKKSTKSPHGLPGINPTILSTKNLKIEEGFKSQLSFRGWQIREWLKNKISTLKSVGFYEFWSCKLKSFIHDSNLRIEVRLNFCWKLIKGLRLGPKPITSPLNSLNFFFILAVSCQNWQNSDFKSQFSISKTIRIFLNFFSLKNLI